MDIVKRAIGGEQQAILQLIEQDEDLLYAIAFSYVKQQADALDAMQELTYKALRKMHTIKDPAYVRTWLTRVLINCCLDILKKRLIVTDQFVEQPIAPPEVSDLQTLLQQLSTTEQQLIYAKFFQQLKTDEMAQLFAIPEGTVKSRLHATLKKLRKLAGHREDWL